MDATERTVKTFVQTFAGTLVSLAAVNGGVEWSVVITSSLIAGGLAVATSVAGTRFGNPRSASFLPAAEEPAAPPPPPAP